MTDTEKAETPKDPFTDLLEKGDTSGLRAETWWDVQGSSLNSLACLSTKALAKNWARMNEPSSMTLDVKSVNVLTDGQKLIAILTSANALKANWTTEAEMRQQVIASLTADQRAILGL